MLDRRCPRQRQDTGSSIVTAGDAVLRGKAQNVVRIMSLGDGHRAADQHRTVDVGDRQCPVYRLCAIAIFPGKRTACSNDRRVIGAGDIDRDNMIGRGTVVIDDLERVGERQHLSVGQIVELVRPGIEGPVHTAHSSGVADDRCGWRIGDREHGQQRAIGRCTTIHTAGDDCDTVQRDRVGHIHIANIESSAGGDCRLALVKIAGGVRRIDKGLVIRAGQDDGHVLRVGCAIAVIDGHRIGDRQLLTYCQIIELVGTAVERPIHGSCGRSIIDSGPGNTGGGAKHCEQCGIRWGVTDDAGLGHSDSAYGDLVADVDVLDIKGTVRLNCRFGFVEILAHVTGSDHRHVVGAGYRDDDIQGVLRALIIDHRHGIGECQLFTDSKVVELVRPGIERP